MTRKRRRLIAVLAGLTMLGVATVLVLLAFNDNLVFFYSPSDLQAKHVAEGRRICVELIATFADIPGVAGVHVIAPEVRRRKPFGDGKAEEFACFPVDEAA